MNVKYDMCEAKFLTEIRADYNVNDPNASLKKKMETVDTVLSIFTQLNEEKWDPLNTFSYTVVAKNCFDQQDLIPLVLKTCNKRLREINNQIGLNRLARVTHELRRFPLFDEKNIVHLDEELVKAWYSFAFIGVPYEIIAKNDAAKAVKLMQKIIDKFPEFKDPKYIPALKVAALAVAHKINNDRSYNTDSFAYIFGIDIKVFYNLECGFLSWLDFEVHTE